jgi:hypothetical protein
MEKETNNFSATFLMKIVSSAISGAFTHPLRVCLNEASVAPTFVGTLKGARERMFSDVSLNLTRVTLSIGFQSIVNHSASLCFGQNIFGRSMGVAGASLAALSITPIEVRFMRKNALRSLTGALHSNQQLIYNRRLLAFFGIRDVLFSMGAFGTENLSLWQKMPVLLPCAVISAMGHKLVCVEATKDIRGIVDSVPNYSLGYRAAFRNIAYGHITHDAFKVSYPNPKSTSQLINNFMGATCGRNMFFWRLLYIGVFSQVLSRTNQSVESAAQHRLFKPARICKQQADVEEQKEEFRKR